MRRFHSPQCVSELQDWKDDREEEDRMAESTYKVIELIGSSTESWEDAANTAIKSASQSLRDLRIAEVVELDMQLEEGNVVAYRARIKVSFKYTPE